MMATSGVQYFIEKLSNILGPANWQTVLRSAVRWADFFLQPDAAGSRKKLAVFVFAEILADLMCVV